MTYVGLNPIRTGIAQTSESSEYTRSARRLRERADAQVVQCVTADPFTTPENSDRHAASLKPIAGLLHHRLHQLSIERYVERSAWNASIAISGKQRLESPNAALKAIGCD
jgi:hypothetical protein